MTRFCSSGVRLFLSASLLFTALIPYRSLALADESLPTIVSQGKKVADFVPPGWRIFKQAEGDLDHNRQNDFALILAKEGDNPEAGYSDPPFSTTPRLLVILHGTANGDLKTACVSKGAVMNGKIANDFALLAVGIEITKGNLVLTQGNGATSIETFTSKYRFQNNRYELIGLTDSGGNTRSNSFWTEDSNLNTGNTSINSTEGETTISDFSFYNLRTGEVSTPPSMSGTFRPEEWPGLAINLMQKSNLAKGQSAWKVPADLSAEVRGVHTASDLYISAKVTLKVPNKAASIRLFNSTKKIFLAQQTKTQVTDSGEYIEAKFPLAALKSTKEGPSGRIPRAFDLLNLSIEILEPASPPAPEMVLSSSCNGEKHPGTIGLNKSESLPTLETWDWAKRDN